MTTNERFDEFYYNKDYDASAHEILTFIAQEKNLLLDQAIEELDKRKHNGDCELEVCIIDMHLDEVISKLKELKE